MDSLLVHFKGEEDFVKRYLDILNEVDRYQSLHLTEFLNPRQQTILQSLIGRFDGLKLVFDGGIVNSESKRCIIVPEYYEIEPSDFQIHLFKVQYSSKFEKLKHSDILGALMSLKIKRGRFGDIVINDQTYFVCDEKIAPLIMQELQSIRKTKVKLVSSNEVIENKIEYTIRSFFVASFRLDVLLSAFYHLSRSEINRYIQAGFVKVNHKEVVEKQFLCNNMDVLSFKHHGRVKIVDTGRITKQGNHVVEGYFYK